MREWEERGGLTRFKEIMPRQLGRQALNIINLNKPLTNRSQELNSRVSPMKKTQSIMQSILEGRHSGLQGAAFMAIKQNRTNNTACASTQK